MVFVHRFNSHFHSIFTLQVTGCDFRYGPNYGVPSNPTFGSDDFSFLGKVCSRQATESVNCENSSVSCVMKYCPTSTVVKNPASAQNLITPSCIGNKYVCLHHTWNEQWVRLSCHNKSPCSDMAKFYILHTNLRLLRRH